MIFGQKTLNDIKRMLVLNMFLSLYRGYPSTYRILKAIPEWQSGAWSPWRPQFKLPNQSKKLLVDLCQPKEGGT